MQSELFTITQMAARYQVTLRTLRFYEDKGLLSPIRRGNSRLYTVRDRVRMELIIKGRALGFTLSEIEELIATVPGSNTSSEEASGDVLPFEDNLFGHLTRQQMEKQLAHLERQQSATQAGIDELRRALAVSPTEAPKRSA